MSLLLQLFNEYIRKIPIVNYFYLLLETQPIQIPKSTWMQDRYNYLNQLIELCGLSYGDETKLFIARIIYRFRGSIQSINELSKYLNLIIDINGYPSTDLSGQVQIIVSGDSYVGDPNSLIYLLKKIIPELLWVDGVTYEISLMEIVFVNPVKIFELEETHLLNLSYVGGSDEISTNTNIFKWRIST